MSTFHANTPGNASDSATWLEGAVPSATDHWIINAEIDLDSGLPAGSSGGPQLDAGGQIEIVQFCILDADVTFTINTGASLVLDSNTSTLEVLGILLIDGGTFDNSAVGNFSGDSGAAVLAAYNNALLINPTTFFSGEWFPQILGDGSGGPASIQLQYTNWTPPATATYFPPVEILASVANGATLDFTTRDDSGAVNDPDFLPTVPVVQAGSLTDTIITLRRNGVGSYTATFPTPSGDQSYYVPICWTIYGYAYVQEFRVAVLNPDLPGKVLGGGSSALIAAGVITANPAEVTEINVTTETTTIRS